MPLGQFLTGLFVAGYIILVAYVLYAHTKPR